MNTNKNNFLVACDQEIRAKQLLGLKPVAAEVRRLATWKRQLAEDTNLLTQQLDMLCERIGE